MNANETKIQLSNEQLQLLKCTLLLVAFLAELFIGKLLEAVFDNLKGDKREQTRYRSFLFLTHSNNTDITTILF